MILLVYLWNSNLSRRSLHKLAKITKLAWLYNCTRTRGYVGSKHDCTTMVTLDIT